MHSIQFCLYRVNELLAVGLFLAFDGASMRTDHFTSGKKYRKLVNNAIFIRNKSLFFVSAAAMHAFLLEHMLWLLRSVCPGGLSNIDYRIWENISHVLGNIMGEYTRYTFTQRK